MSTGEALMRPAPGPLPATPAPLSVPVTTDILGIFGIPVAELAAAVRMAVPETLLTAFFPIATPGTALSRSAVYYRPQTAVEAMPALRSALSRLDRHRDAPVGLLRRAVVENLRNVYAAVAYRCWEYVTHASAEPHAALALAELLDAATVLSAELTEGAERSLDPAELPSVPAWLGNEPLRSFRELDNQQKIQNELVFLLEQIIDPRPEVTALVIPLYGSFSLGLSARAWLPAVRPDRPLTVHLIRLGFHDLGSVDYLGADGAVRAELTAPAAYLEALARDAADADVLVVDDNVGYGTTLRASRTLIAQMGGRAITRSVETAWHLYHRSGSHDVADAADIPSLRPNLHHRVQSRLIGHLLRGNLAGYRRDPAHHLRETLPQQMRSSYDLALSLGTWRTDQLRAMRAELAQAELWWTEPAIPQPER